MNYRTNVNKSNDKKVNDTKFTDNYNFIACNVIDNFCDEIMTCEDKLLLKLAFTEKPSQEELDEVLNKIDIEALGGNKALLLSYVMKRHPELRFREYEGPRLIGLLKFFRFQNMKLIAHFKKVVEALNKNKIPSLIIKGGAMKHIRPELSRIMGDIDILIPYNEFKKAKKIVKELGYEFEEYIHSIDLHPSASLEGAVDIHRYIDMQTGFEKSINNDLFKRAKKEKIFFTDAYLPSYEDLMFLTLLNIEKNLRNNTSSAGILFALFDCKFFLENKPDFDWDIIIKNTKKTKTQLQISFAIKFINKISPDILLEKIPEGVVFENELDSYCKLIKFDQTYFFYIRDKAKLARQTKTVKSIKEFKENFTVRALCYLITRLRRKSFLMKDILQLIDY